MAGSGLRVHERLGERLGPTTCPICRAAPVLTPDSPTTTTLLLPSGSHPRCPRCTVLMGRGHAEANVGELCDWCATHGAAPVRHPVRTSTQRNRLRNREIVAARGQGVELKDLVRQYGLSRYTVWHILRVAKNGRAA